jgi:hypothetical protein
MAKQHYRMLGLGSLAIMPKTTFLFATNGSMLLNIAAEHCPLTCENAICKAIRRSVKIAMAKQHYRMGLGSLVSVAKQAQNNLSLCEKWKEIRDFCPVTCSSC